MADFGKIERYLIHRRTRELNRIRGSYSEQRQRLQDVRNLKIGRVYRRYGGLLEEVLHLQRHSDSETLRIDLSVVKADRCCVLLEAVFYGQYTPAPIKGDPSTLREACIESLSTLTLRERGILIHRLGLDGSALETLKDVAKRYDVTRERIRQIEAKALRKMRYPTRSGRLKHFFLPVEEQEGGQVL